MTDTPTTPAVGVAKPQLQQVSNWIGALVGVVGNLLPYITPDFLAGLGLSPTVVHTVSSVVAVLLFAYQKKQPPVAASKQAGKASVAGMLVLCAVALPMFGCAYLSQVIAPAAQPFVLAGVDVAVAQAVADVSKKTGESPQVVAARIKGVAQQILIADNSVTTTVAALEVDLNAKILALKLPPPELMAALSLAASLEAALTTYIQTTPKGQVVASTQVAIADIANAVITAAGAYGA